MKKGRFEVAKVPVGKCLQVGSMGGRRQGVCETNMVVIGERKGGVIEVAGSAEVGEYEDKSVVVAVSGGLCPLC